MVPVGMNRAVKILLDVKHSCYKVTLGCMTKNL